MNTRRMLAPFHRRAPASAGFTLMETVIVILLLGILAVYLAPKAFTPAAMTLRAQTRNFASDLQRAQMLATTSGVSVQVQVNTQQYSVQYSPDGVKNVIATNVNLSDAFFSAGTGTFTLNSLGQPSDGQPKTIQLSSTGAPSPLTVKIYATSGLIEGP